MPRVVSVKVERLTPEKINSSKSGAKCVETEVKGDVKPRVKQELITDHLKVEKKRKAFDRFNGTSKEELMTRSLPDRLKENLDIVFIGINPGLFAAYKQHYYAGPGNHFWKCLFLSGLVPEPMTSDDDESINDYGIGFTNMVARTTPGSNDLTRTEIKEGSKILLEKMQRYKPRIIVFNGKGIYEVFNSCFGDKNKNFPIGKQSHFFPGTESYIYVVPSSSARCAQLPRAIDKVPFYAALKKFRDYLKGDLEKLDENEVMFPDLEMVAAPVEPEARAIFMEEKRIRDEEKKAERLRIKMEKKVKEEEEGIGGGDEGGAAVAGKKRPSKSPGRPPKKQQQQQQQQQQPIVKTEQPDEFPSTAPSGVPSAQDASPYFPSNSASASVHASHSSPSPSSRNSPFPDVAATFPVGAPFSANVAAISSSPTNGSVNDSQYSLNSPTLSSTTASATHSNSPSQSPSSTSLTQMTPSLKKEDPHLISALQFLNQNEMLNPQQMSEQFSQYSHYFTPSSQGSLADL